MTMRTLPTRPIPTVFRNASAMHPLPVRPIGDALPTIPTRPTTPGMMHPQAVTPPGAGTPDLAEAIRTRAFEAMLERLGIDDLGELSDPTI